MVFRALLMVAWMVLLMIVVMFKRLWLMREMRRVASTARRRRMNWVWCASCVGIGFGGHRRSVCFCGAKMMGGVHVGWGWCKCCAFGMLLVGGGCVGLKLGLRFVCVPSWMRGCRS